MFSEAVIICTSVTVIDYNPLIISVFFLPTDKFDKYFYLPYLVATCSLLSNNTWSVFVLTHLPEAQDM